MQKEWLKLQSIGKATTRIVSIRTDLIRRFVPNANASTPLYGRWEISEDGTHLKFYIVADYEESSTSTSTTETTDTTTTESQDGDQVQ